MGNNHKHGESDQSQSQSTNHHQRPPGPADDFLKLLEAVEQAVFETKIPRSMVNRIVRAANRNLHALMRQKAPGLIPSMNYDALYHYQSEENSEDERSDKA